jgi:predicted DNA-binding protein (MmcQ/YjbR family)
MAKAAARKRARPAPKAAPKAKAAKAAKKAPKPRTWMDEEHAFKRRDWDKRWLARFRGLCLAFPGAEEAEQFGGPWFKVGGKSFACYGAESEKVGPDEYRGVDGAAFNVTLLEQAALLEDPRFTRTHYVGQHGWTTMRWDAEPGWDEVRELLESAYRKVAGKRHLALLDAR